MARERWFYAKDMRRMGPLPKRQLLESLLALPDPRSCLIWRHGLPAWTLARDVPEIALQLAPFVKEEPAPPPSESPLSYSESARSTPAVRVPPAAHAPNVALYFGGLGALAALVLVAWLVWPRAKEERVPATTLRAGQATATADPTRPGGMGATGAVPGSGAGAFAGWSAEEEELPAAELRQLRGVGGWSADKLTVTLYNGSTWRITEILVRTSRLRGDEFVDSETPHRLLPTGGAPVDAGTAELLKKIAPDRRKPGVNPLDTGPFEATIGPQPEAYRWRLEGARGYPPLH